MSIRYDSVLLMAYGAPETMEEVRPFLDNILRGLPVPRERYEAVVHHYELIGGKSPLNELTGRQADGLARLARRRKGPTCRSMWGCGSPGRSVYTAIRDMIRDGRRRAVAIILAPYRSEPSFEKYQEAVQEVLDAAGPEVAPGSTSSSPGSTIPCSPRPRPTRSAAALEAIPEARRDAAAAGLHRAQHPDCRGRALPYVAQIEAACGNVARHARTDAPGSLAWQSRSGNPRTPWLEPDVNAVLRRLKDEGVDRRRPLPDRIYFRPRRSLV